MSSVGPVRDRSGTVRAAQLLVLAKEPLPGRVKTRLVPPCTFTQAAALATAAIADTLDAVRRAPVARRVLAGSEPDGGAGALRAAGRATGHDWLAQRGGPLGERIAAAYADAAAGGPPPTLQIGMDTPQVTPDLLAGCVDALLTSGVDAVLGPAEDGGWWALGLRDPAHAALVAAVPMSTQETGALTFAALRRAGLRVRELPVLRDVDDIADARAVAALVPHGRFAATLSAIAPRTGSAGGVRR